MTRGHGGARAHPNLGRPANFCRRCLAGDHSRAHTQMGCTAPVAYPPRDWICVCLLTPEEIREENAKLDTGATLLT